MLKKLNQKLITSYPLVWNLKLIWIYGAALLLNAIAFVHGFLKFRDKSDLLAYNCFRVDYGTIGYIFVCLILVIIWLYFYLKNNRFKSYYPTSRLYLFKEFLSIFFLFLLFCYIPNSIQLGYQSRVARYMSEAQYLKDIDIINRASVFTLRDKDNYTNDKRKVSVLVFDTLVSEKQTRELFKERIEYKGDNPKEFLEPYYQNKEYEILLLEHFPHRKIALGDTLREGGMYSNIDNSNLENLYNYNSLVFKNPKDPTKNKDYYSQERIKLLEKNDRVAIENLLRAYTELLDRHGIDYRFKKSKWIDYIPKYPYYFIDEYLIKDKYDDDHNSKNKDYINLSALNNFYRNIQIAKYNKGWLDHIEDYTLFALIFTMLIITFRLSSFKVWLISIVGSGVLFILAFVLFSIFYNEINFLYTIFFIYYTGFVLLSLFGLKRKKNKLITGINLNWFVFANTFLGFIIINLFMNIDLFMLKDYFLWVKIRDIYFWINPLLYIISFYFIIGLYKKWQAMPEE